MLYGENKVRSIARSLLPSSARVRARDELATIKRRSRRHLRQEMALIASDPEVYYDRDRINLNVYPDAEIHYVVRERRDCDNVSAFLAWAEARADGPENAEENYDKIKTLLPNNLIGRHALSHLRYSDSYYVPYEHREIYGTLRNYYQVRAEQSKTLAQELVETLSSLLGNGKHQMVNDAVKKAHKPVHWRYSFYKGPMESYRCDGCELRLLMGQHDVDAFANHVIKNKSLHSEDYEVLMSLTGR